MGESTGGGCPFGFGKKKQGESLFDEHSSYHSKLLSDIMRWTRFDEFLNFVNTVMKPLPTMAQSIVSTLFISIVPIFLIYCLNILFLSSPSIKQAVIYYLIAFAIGGLLGDVFFHTIPHMSHSHGGEHEHEHAHEEHSHDHGHDHHEHEHHGHEHHGHSEAEMINNSIIVLGIIVFFIIEKISTSILGDGHSHDHGKGKKDDHKHHEEEEKQARYRSYAVLSLIGDMTHNFTDGLSIGVAYVANYKMGITTTLAMFFHEIPHEVGDFAILFQLKYSLCQILGFQLMTAVGALLGTALGDVIGQRYLTQCLAFTSGGFLYFAINGLLSELKEVKSFISLVICFLSMGLGLYFMYVFALLE